MVAESLGNIVKCIQDKEAYLILTQTLREFVTEIDWSSPKAQGVLREIYRLFSQLFLTTPGKLLQIDVSTVTGHQPHPLPIGTLPDQGLIELWCDEIGRLLVLHDRSLKGNGFFIGIACEKGFAGDLCNSYFNPTGKRAFPLVGPPQLSDLEDGYEWVLPSNSHQIEISFDDVKRHFKAIGGVRFEPPRSGGTHFKVHFGNCRPWTCDINWGRSIGENVLNELKPLCNLPLLVIKYALRNGSLPPQRIRLDV
ncbi:MAG: hypothetical protein JSS26_10070 [Nitrospira sp.]|nr:hypothetical protein [Nitrospira sp.]